MRSRGSNIKLNKGRLQPAKTEMPYMGHLLTTEGTKANPAKVEAI